MTRGYTYWRDYALANHGMDEQEADAFAARKVEIEQGKPAAAPGQLEITEPGQTQAGDPWPEDCY